MAVNGGPGNNNAASTAEGRVLGLKNKRRRTGTASSMCNGGTINVAKLAEEEPLEMKKTKKEKAGTEHRLMSYDELPEYMKENEFIRDYYRAEWPLKNALFSLFRWHNETLNVWTHLIGFLVFVWLTAANLRHAPDVADLLNNFSW